MHYIVLYYLISFILDGRFSMKGSPLSNIKYLHIAVHHVRSSTGEETKKKPESRVIQTAFIF